ncbi:MAG: bifunctional DNA-formamidopyrimidine glycosylase/DNA-(apurinic or apyrimidinic site) lyase [Elusimicrobia bacterium]|nr:bifunctional DNA-formamidopyrimidine glycosylase/DNA-(apurinic or apyrimidinic site) lyase [Elusimicrobiota bacterium]
MPELPEVETVRRSLEPRLRGHVISACEIRPPGFNHKAPPGLLRAALGKKILALRRRGKYLILDLSDGKNLILHLGMSGRLSLGEDGPHARFILRAGPASVVFQDPRRFGRVGCALPPLGPEPLSGEFTVEHLRRTLGRSRASVKSILMDQSVVAGIGNIYATEALYLAKIRPQRPGRRVSREECAQLHAATRRVLALAVKSGGSTLKDESFLDPRGRPGGFQKFVNVYGRKIGRACGHDLKATPKPLAGRTSLYCPLCQK